MGEVLNLLRVDGTCGHEDGDDELQDRGDDLFCRCVIRSVEPFFNSAVDGPARCCGDDFGREARSGAFFRHAVHDDAANGGGDGGFDEGFEGVLAGALDWVGVDLGDVVAGGEDNSAGGGGAGAIEGYIALVKKNVEAAGDHGFEEGVFVGVMVVEGGAIDGGRVGDVLYGNLFDVL